MLSNHVTRSVPANNATAAPVTTVISVTFDDSIRFLRVSRNLIRVSKRATGARVEGRSAYDQATRTLSFTPHQPLEHDTEYLVSHDPSRALEGADPNMMLTCHSWGFTTTRTRPTINIEVLEVRSRSIPTHQSTNRSECCVVSRCHHHHHHHQLIGSSSSRLMQEGYTSSHRTNVQVSTLEVCHTRT